MNKQRELLDSERRLSLLEEKKNTIINMAKETEQTKDQFFGYVYTTLMNKPGIS